MKRMSSASQRETAKFLWDICKLTAAAAFITPWFTTVNIELHVILWMAFASIATFVVGAIFHHRADDITQQEHAAEQGRQQTQPSRHNDNSRTNNIEGERHGRRRRNRKKQINYGS